MIGSIWFRTFTTSSPLDVYPANKKTGGVSTRQESTRKEVMTLEQRPREFLLVWTQLTPESKDAVLAYARRQLVKQQTRQTKRPPKKTTRKDE